MSARLDLSDFVVARLNYQSNPWRVVHTPTGKEVSVPKSLQNIDGKDVFYRGPAAFPRKRDALRWVSDELPALVEQYNANYAAPTPHPRETPE